MGGKDSGSSSQNRGTRDSYASTSQHNTSSSSATSRSVSTAPFYRQFLPTQLSAITNNDSIPSLDELMALAKHLSRLKNESVARQSRLDAQSTDPLKPLFTSAPNDLFSPAGLSTSSVSLYSDNSRHLSKTASKQQRTADRSKVASPAPSGSQTLADASSSNSAKHQIKRERDADSDSYLDASPSKAGKFGARSKGAAVQSFDMKDDVSVVSTDPDWDMEEDSVPSRPGRTYGKNKKRRRKESDLDSQDEDSGSEFEASSMLASDRPAISTKPDGSAAPVLTSPAKARTAQDSSTSSDTARAGTDLGKAANNTSKPASTFGMRLKLNPAGSVPAIGPVSSSSKSTSALQRNISDVTQMSTRRNSAMPSPSPHPSTLVRRPPVVHEPAPGWELPARTPSTFMPVLEKPRPPRAYPTKPQEVNENFAEKDWKEKEKERDRMLERESVGPGTPLGPGQSLIKEAVGVGKRGGRDLQQTPIATFYNYADAFFKTLTEDDLAWLSSKSDDHEPFQMPALGRHYRKIWEEEDALLASGIVDAYGLPLEMLSRTPSFSLASGVTGLGLESTSLAGKSGMLSENGLIRHAELDLPPPPRFKPAQLTDQHLGLDSVVDARSGPLAERLVAALLPTIREVDYDGEINYAESDGHYTSSGTNMNHVYRQRSNGFDLDDDDLVDEDADGEPDLDFENLMHDQDMVGLEERIKKELKALDVLGTDEDVDWGTRADDEISTTLRMVQRALASQQKTNEMRKSRLFEIAKDRMAYQDYLNCLHSVEKEIEVGWAKRLRQIKASLGKRKKGGGLAHSTLAAHHDEANGTISANGTPQPGGATYNGPVRPQLPENVVTAMERREMLQKAFKGMFDTDKHAWQTPTESIYTDLPIE